MEIKVDGIIFLMFLFGIFYYNLELNFCTNYAKDEISESSKTNKKVQYNKNNRNINSVE